MEEEAKNQGQERGGERKVGGRLKGNNDYDKKEDEAREEEVLEPKRRW